MKNISVGFNGGTPVSSVVLKGLNLHVKAGEFVVIIGGNGTGKSTLFNVIAGLVRPTSGRVIIGGEDVTKISQHGRSGHIARVTQEISRGTMANLTIFENLSFASMRGKCRGLLPHSNALRRKVFSEKLASFGIGLENRMHNLVGNLSGGQKQMVSLLMAVLSESKILLLDEITAALDPKIAEKVMEFANKIVGRENKTTLMVTHNMSHAIKYGDRTLVLADRHFAREFHGAEKKALTPASLAEIFNEI
ncbi:MAG: ATP-binding cassette domain-containing protein [Puniceicoccales bacterium]|nr:ATP-binding cassette domain-containing protein [Puniceicoccales bacterium]